MKFFIPSFKILPLSLYILIPVVFLVSCEGMQSGTTAQKPKETAATQLDPDSSVEGPSALGEKSTMEPGESQSRGLDMSLARVPLTSLSEDFPLLYQVCQSDPELIRELEAYARKVLAADVKTEADILDLMEKRDSSLIPYMTPLFENMDRDEFDEKWGKYQEELQKLGMTMTAAEGMFTSIGGAPFLQDKVAEVGSKEFQAYVAFFNSLTESRNGEYPFQNMKPFRDMVLAGETIMKGNNETYKKRIDEEFQFALEAFTDVHYVSNPGTRQVDIALTGGTHTDPYPYLMELETAREFVAGESTSQYKKAISEILKNPSEISEKPENIYVVVIEWAKSKNMAQMRVRSHLGKGEDVPHHLKIRRGDGTDQYAVTYRFYENEDKANTAFDEAIKKFPDARLIYCSVKNGDLYQLGI